MVIQYSMLIDSVARQSLLPCVKEQSAKILGIAITPWHAMACYGRIIADGFDCGL